MLLYLLTAHLTPVCTARGRQRVSRAVGFPFRLRAGGIDLAFRGCRDDLCLALRLGQFIELLLGVLLLDLFVLDGFLVGFIEADIRQSCLFQLHAVLGQPRGKRLLDIQFDLWPLPKHLVGDVQRGVRLQHLLRCRQDNNIGKIDADFLVHLGRPFWQETVIQLRDVGLRLW
jgi:hypothetical protein